MTKRLPREDTLPWYRQFWPWFIILLPASVVVAGLSTLYIANRHADDLVVDEYYKDGLAINRQLEKKQRAEELGIAATLRFDGDKVAVSLSGSESAPELQLTLSHPLEADRDFVTTLIRSTPGQYLGRLQGEVAPRWHWTLELPEANGWRLDGSLSAGDFSDEPR
ncbi:MAG: hypothetical protein GWP63_03965 [Haliea sp.]|jgi:hypothetical protein|nr:hypothetical protein [Haliea sp.]